MVSNEQYNRVSTVHSLSPYAIRYKKKHYAGNLNMIPVSLRCLRCLSNRNKTISKLKGTHAQFNYSKNKRWDKIKVIKHMKDFIMLR